MRSWPKRPTFHNVSYIVYFAAETKLVVLIRLPFCVSLHLASPLRYVSNQNRQIINIYLGYVFVCMYAYIDTFILCTHSCIIVSVFSSSDKNYYWRKMDFLCWFKVAHCVKLF